MGVILCLQERHGFPSGLPNWAHALEGETSLPVSDASSALLLTGAEPPPPARSPSELILLLHIFSYIVPAHSIDTPFNGLGNRQAVILVLTRALKPDPQTARPTLPGLHVGRTWRERLVAS